MDKLEWLMDAHRQQEEHRKRIADLDMRLLRGQVTMEIFQIQMQIEAAIFHSDMVRAMFGPATTAKQP